MTEALLLAKAAHPQGPFGDFETCHRNTRHNRDPQQQILIPEPRHCPVQRLNKLLPLNIARTSTSPGEVWVPQGSILGPTSL